MNCSLRDPALINGKLCPEFRSPFYLLLISIQTPLQQIKLYIKLSANVGGNNQVCCPRPCEPQKHFIFKSRLSWQDRQRYEGKAHIHTHRSED